MSSLSFLQLFQPGLFKGNTSIYRRAAVAVLALCALIVPVQHLQAQSAQESVDVSGHWQGTLVAGQFDPLELIFRIQGESGAWSATLDIPAHSRYGLTADSVSVRNGNIMIRLNSLQAEYYGSLLVDQGKVTGMDGDWSQSGEHIPLKLVPAAQ